MKNLFRQTIHIVLFSLIVTPLLFMNQIQVHAAEPIQISSSNPDIVPGQVLVKYKNHPIQENSFVGIESTSPLLQTMVFPKETSIIDKISELQKDPNVEYAEPVYMFHIEDYIKKENNSVVNSVYYDGNNMNYMQNWGKTVTNLPYASNLTTGSQSSQVVVAVIDTGVDLTHPDLMGSIVQGYDFINNKSSAQDDHGHGTHVSGIIAANAHDVTGYTGVAPGTKIMPIKVLDDKGKGPTTNIVFGIQYAVSHGANIINLSLGSSGDSRALHDAIKQAVQNGVLVVAAAGNESNNWINNESGQLDNDPQNDTHRKAHLADYPALYDEVISVGAIEQLNDNSLVVADFSNLLKVDVAAPGVNIYSTYLHGGYAVFHGTSQATPFVSGLAALLKANDPNLKANTLTAIIENSASNMPNISTSYENVNRNGNVFLYNFDYYGHGLISGYNPFRFSRYKLVPDLSSLSINNTVSLTVYSKDFHGNDDGNISLTPTLANFEILEDALYRDNNTISSDIGVGGRVLQTVNGMNSTSFPMPIPMKDAYHYIFYFDNNASQIRSNTLELIKRPVLPVPSLGSGTYDSGTQLTLTSSTPNADIYYALINGTDDGFFHKYTGPITLNKTTSLVTYSKKNHVYSDDPTEYIYTITPAPTLPPTGGGGGGFFVPPTPTPLPDSSEELLKPDKDQLLKQINSSTSNEVVIDALTKGDTDKLTVELTGDIFQKAKEVNKSLSIKSNDVQFVLPAGLLNLNDSSAKVQLTAAKSSGQNLQTQIPDFSKSVSTIYEFSLTVNGEKVTSFDLPVKVSFTFDPSKVKDTSKLGIYYFNEKTGVWDYVGGEFNGDKSITASLGHFSKYVVMENNKTFDDIQSHWAQKEIERLTAKQIVDGLTDQLFNPETQITRAQFVTMLTKSLKLKNSADTGKFNDISDSAWYKDAVYAAVQANIVNGTSESTFEPETVITREQMATMMVNAYFSATGKTYADIAITQEVKYGDEGSISDWARTNVRLNAALGIMNGANGGDFNPSQNASRAQAAVVISRLLDIIKK